jgi:TonB family protein
MLFSLIVPSTPGLQKAAESFEQLLKQGAQHYKDKEYDEAIRDLKKALELNSNSAEACFFLALAYSDKRFKIDAIRYAQEAVRLQPVFPDAHYILAVLLYETHRVERTYTVAADTDENTRLKQALQQVQIAVRQGAQSANVYELKGTIEFEDFKFEDALHSYEEAMRGLSPKHPYYKNTQEKISQFSKLVKFRQEHYIKVDQKPIPLNRPRLNYPEKARQNKIQGVIAVCARIDEQGEVTECMPFLPLGYGLEEEAVKGVKKMKFSPAMKDNQPSSYWAMLIVVFELR